ncbi:BOS complex subunit TMEM147 [Heterodontus francisci]|uniref:BOS complex subunit TMEM147 n=1 Tax=Heterodontus francisci TaxID=7792 RepID=UPI00355C88DF
MTLFHFGNCFALAYFPYFIAYKCTGLSEYNAFWRCVQAGATYLFVQLCKMMFLATFFPTWDASVGVYDFIGEFMKSTVDLADLVGLHLVMSKNAGKGEYKIMVAAMGWSTAELIMSRLARFAHSLPSFSSHRSFVYVLVLGSWTALLIKAVVTGAISLSALILYVSLVHGS